MRSVPSSLSYSLNGDERRSEVDTKAQGVVPPGMPGRRRRAPSASASDKTAVFFFGGKYPLNLSECQGGGRDHIETVRIRPGCLFTVQIRKHRSGILIPRLPMILAGLWEAIRKRSQVVRKEAAKALCECLYLAVTQTSNRESHGSFTYLLKGNEDIRQDERVMQVLSLANTLLEDDARTQKRNASATVYSITPLSDSAGLIGWVDNCDTLEQICTEHRKRCNIELEAELLSMWQLYGQDPDMVDYARLSTMQKVQVFEHGRAKTNKDEIARTMWIRSPTAELWLERRTTYIRSLATMSVVGYILGLGDRHLGNLMLGRYSGKMVHIDFGDCFETTMTRQYRPETVPFRLTMILENAMGVCGVDGMFLYTCQNVMDVLRSERDNLMALLEAFVHDPLISWRLNKDEVDDEQIRMDETHVKISEKTAAEKATAEPEFLGMAEYGEKREELVEDCAASIPEIHFRIGSLLPPRSFVRSLYIRGMTLTACKSVAIGVNNDKLSHTNRAKEVVNRIREKLSGTEDTSIPPKLGKVRRGINRGQATAVSCEDQVVRLIRQATSSENLSRSYYGWGPHL